MAQPTLRDLATVILRELIRPTYSKLVTLAFLFVASIMAEWEGYLVIGRPGDTAIEAENPVAVVTLALLVGAAAQGARMGLFPPMTPGLLHRVVVVLGLMTVIALVVAAIGGHPGITLLAWLFVLMLALSPGPYSGAPPVEDERIDCPVCDGHGYLLDDDDLEIGCERCDGSGKVLAQEAETHAG